jgi:hypothetical protein
MISFASLLTKEYFYKRNYKDKNKDKFTNSKFFLIKTKIITKRKIEKKQKKMWGVGLT